MEGNSATRREISCRVTRTLIMYVKDRKGTLGNLLEGLELDEAYLNDSNQWVSHEFLQRLYARMADSSEILTRCTRWPWLPSVFNPWDFFQLDPQVGWKSEIGLQSGPLF